MQGGHDHVPTGVLAHAHEEWGHLSGVQLRFQVMISSI